MGRAGLGHEQARVSRMILLAGSLLAGRSEGQLGTPPSLVPLCGAPAGRLADAWELSSPLLCSSVEALVVAYK